MRAAADRARLAEIEGKPHLVHHKNVALGLAVTDGDLAPEAIVDAVIALAGGALALSALPRRTVGVPAALAWGGMFVGFVVFAAL